MGEDENIFNWDLMIIGPPGNYIYNIQLYSLNYHKLDTLFEGGFFNARLEFPPDFPNSPPVMRFITPIWHPNGYSIFNDYIYFAFCKFL